MPKLTALIHVDEPSRELQRTLESVQFADDILVIIDTSSADDTLKYARKLHARLKTRIPGVSAGAYAMDAFYEWVLVLRPGEWLSSETAETLKRWREQKKDTEIGYELPIHSVEGSTRALRLVNRQKMNWTGELPPKSGGVKELPVAA